MTRPSLQHRVTRLDSAVHHGGALGLISMIVMHDTEGYSAKSSIDYLNSTTDKRSSYHYLIDRDGSILRMTQPTVVAYHSGDSAWPNPIRATPTNQKPHGGKSVNGFSLGIAFASKEEKPTEKQLESGLWLCATCMDSYPKVTVDRIRGHYEVSPGRKNDPTPNDMPAFRALLTTYMTGLSDT